MQAPLLIYGAYGYTGKLIVEEAIARGLRPCIGGRNDSKLAALGEEYNLERRTFALDSRADVDAALEGIACVVNCAGPFSRTAAPLADACLRRRVHYTDITGEIAVFEAMAARDRQAQEAGIMLMPGTGFDVVPSDCLARHLKERVPEATHLCLGFYSKGKASHGTATTVVENIASGGMIRQDGRLTPVPTGSTERKLDFGEEQFDAISIPWGDVATAWYSTGIPNIEVYIAVPPNVRRMTKITRHLGWLLGSAPVQRLLKGTLSEGGPDAETRAKNYCLLWGEVRDSSGNRAEARMRTPDGYSLTADAAVTIAQKVLAGDAPAGYQTPAKAYGPDLVMELAEVRRW